jgi:hypothetical protein
LRLAFLGDVEPAHQLQARDERGRRAVAVDDLLLQLPVDAQPNPEAALVGLDVDVGRVDVHGVLEHRLDQLDDGRVGRALFGGQGS